MKNQNNFQGFVPVLNNRIKTKPNRHHNQTCPFCGDKKKNINLHYKLYHQDYVNRINKIFKKSEIGILYGVRFIETEKNKDE